MNATVTTTTSTSDRLLALPSELNIYLGLFFLLSGTIGCFGNILVFGSRRLRERAYAIYLLAEAISNIIYFDFLLLTRILQRGFLISITTRFDALCKIRQFDSVWNHLVSLSFFSLAMIDRILALQRENKYRRWSNRVNLAYKMCLICPLFWLLIFGHRLVLYRGSNGKCGGMAGVYASIDTYMEASLTAMGTPIMMIALGCLLYRSVHNVTHRRVIPKNDNMPVTFMRRTIFQKIDSKLTLMLLCQVMVAVITRIPYASEVVYSNVTVYWSKSPLRKAIEDVVIETIRLLSYTFFTTSFYISLISNRGFRHKFKKFFVKGPSSILSTQ